jgi:hypothetical protein
MLSRHFKLTSQIKRFFGSSPNWAQILSINNIKDQRIKKNFDLDNPRSQNIDFLHDDLELDMLEMQKIKNRNPEFFFNFTQNNIGLFMSLINKRS